MPKTKHEEHFILDGVEVKYCFTCRSALPTTLMYFGEHKTKWDGLNPNCRECKGSYFRPPEGYKKCHKCGRVLKTTENFYWNSIKEQYDSPCKDCVMAYKKCNKEHINKRRRFLRLKNPGPIRVREQKRRSTKKMLPATFTDKQWNLCKEYFNNRCAYCGEEVDILTQDHVIPLVKGGEYTINNIIPACLICNSSKRDRQLLKWYTPKLEFYSELRKKKILKYLKTDGETQQLAFEF